MVGQPLVKQDSIIMSLETVGTDETHDIEKSIASIGAFISRIRFEIREAPVVLKPVKESSFSIFESSASVWETRGRPTYLVFSEAISSTNMFKRNKFLISEGTKSEIVVRPSKDGYKPTIKTKGRLGLTIYSSVVHLFDKQKYDVELIVSGGKEMLMLY